MSTDESILNQQHQEDVSYLNDLAIAVCLNGDSLEKYRNIIIKRFPDDSNLYDKLERLFGVIQEQATKPKFTQSVKCIIQSYAHEISLYDDEIDELITAIEHKKREIGEIVASLTVHKKRAASANLQTKLHLIEGIGYYNYADSNGNIIVSGQWVDAWPFSEGLAAVAKSVPGDRCWKYGYIDVTGKTVIPFQWGNAECFNEGLACVADEEGNHGYIDKTGRLVIPCKYGVADYFCNNRAPIWDNSICKGGYIDKTGKIVIPQKEDWDEILPFREGLAPVRNKEGKWGYIDIYGNLIIPFLFKHAGWFGEGCAAVWVDDERCGYIDQTGRMIISIREGWKSAGWFSESLAPVMNHNNLWGYIDITGRLAIPYRWFNVECFEDGVAWVKPSGHYRLINKSGEYV